MTRTRWLGLIGGLVVFCTMLLAPAPAGMELTAWRIAALTVLMAIWWMTEALPLTVTALLPFLTVPTFGVMDANAIAKKSRRKDDIDHSAGARFETPGHGVVDFTAGWRPRTGVELRLGAYNLGDQRYWRWLDVARLTPEDPTLELLARPGRTYSASLRVNW